MKCTCQQYPLVHIIHSIKQLIQVILIGNLFQPIYDLLLTLDDGTF